MKLKTVPIYIMLDEVVIEAETCENFREEADPNNVNKINLNQYVERLECNYMRLIYFLNSTERQVAMASATK